MKKLTLILTLAILACASVSAPEPANGIEPEKDLVRVTYIVCGDGNFASLAFCSQQGPLDTIPCTVLPFMADFMLATGTEAFMRAHKLDDAESLTVLVIANGFINATDTAVEGDHTAEVRVGVY